MHSKFLSDCKFMLPYALLFFKFHLTNVTNCLSDFTILYRPTTGGGPSAATKVEKA